MGIKHYRRLLGFSKSQTIECQTIEFSNGNRSRRSIACMLTPHKRRRLRISAENPNNSPLRLGAEVCIRGGLSCEELLNAGRPNR